MIRWACGWMVAALLVQNLWMLGAPVIAGPIPEPAAELNNVCPSPGRVHGVGADLKSTVREVDWCAQK